MGMTGRDSKARQSKFAWYRVNVKSQSDIPALRPRARATTTGTLVGTRFQAELLDAIDEWRKAQPDLPTRPEAVRRLVGIGMKNNVPTNHNLTPRKSKE